MLAEDMKLEGQTKDFIMYGSAGSISFMFTSVPLALCVPQG